MQKSDPKVIPAYEQKLRFEKAFEDIEVYFDMEKPERPEVSLQDLERLLAIQPIQFKVHRVAWRWAGRVSRMVYLSTRYLLLGGPRSRLSFDDILSKLRSLGPGKKPPAPSSHASPFQEDRQLLTAPTFACDIEWCEDWHFDATLTIGKLVSGEYRALATLTDGKRSYKAFGRDLDSIISKLVRGKLSGHFEFISRQIEYEKWYGIRYVGPCRKRQRYPKRPVAETFEWDDEIDDEPQDPTLGKMRKEVR